MSMEPAEPKRRQLTCARCGNPVVGPSSWTHRGVICSNCEVVDHPGFLAAMAASAAENRPEGGITSKHYCEPPVDPGPDAPDPWICPCGRVWERRKEDEPEFYDSWYQPRD